MEQYANVAVNKLADFRNQMVAVSQQAISAAFQIKTRLSLLKTIANENIYCIEDCTENQMILLYLELFRW